MSETTNINAVTKISDIVFIKDEWLKKNIYNLKIMVNKEKFNCETAKNIIFDKFIEAHNNNSFIECKTFNNKNYLVFDTGFKFKNSEEKIFAYTQKNRLFSPPYYGIEIARESLLRSELTTDVIHIADIHFNSFYEMNYFLDNLANCAISENWKFSDYDSSVSQPILKSFIEQSFFQAYQQKKIYRNEEEQIICFNTGLIDSFFNDIYLVCKIKKHDEPNALFKEYYVEPEITTTSTRDPKIMDGYPEPPTFFEDMSELLFDCNVKIELNDEHIFKDNLERINASLAETESKYTNPMGCNLPFEGAIKCSIALAKRNYKLIAPQFWPETGTVQFLLPIYLEGRCEDEHRKILPNVALCLERIGNRYLGTSILTLDMAYQNARLIAKPDSFWLEPLHQNFVKSNTKYTDISKFPDDTIVDFFFDEPFINQENKNIIGLFGTVTVDSQEFSAMIHISKLAKNRQISQEEMQRLINICETNSLKAKIVGESDKGLNLSLTDIYDFDELINSENPSECSVD